MNPMLPFLCSFLNKKYIKILIKSVDFFVVVIKLQSAFLQVPLLSSSGKPASGPLCPP